MAEIGRDYLWSLLRMANRVAEYLEGITPDQRDVLQVLGQAPRRVDDGWMTAKAVRSDLGLSEQTNLGAHTLVELGLIEMSNRQGAYCYRITDAGVDLLGRIEEREERDEMLVRIRREWRRTVAPRPRTGQPANAIKGEHKQDRGERFRVAVIETLQVGPMRPVDIQRATGLTDRQVENQLYRLRLNGLVTRFKGVYSLINQQSKEGAA